jgi:O-antigen/teichoic acid export membrane protein
MLPLTEELVPPAAELRSSVSSPASGKTARYIDLLATLADQGVVSFANFAVIVLIGRSLGPSLLGSFTLLWSVALFLNVVQQSFFVAPMLTLRSKFDDEERRTYLSGVAKVQFIFAFLASLLVFFGFRVGAHLAEHAGVLRSCALPLGVACAAFQMQEFCRRLLQACKHLLISLISDLLTYGLQLGLLWIALDRHTGLNGVLWSMAAAWGAGCGFLLAATGTLRSKPAPVELIVKSHAKFGSALAASSLFQWIGAYGALYIAAAALNASAIGNVRAVINLVAPLNVFAVGIQTYLSIEAAERFQRSGVDAMQRFLRDTTLQFIVLGLAGGLLFGAFSKRLPALLFGPAFTISYIWLLVAFVQVLLGAMFGFLVVYFKTVERTHFAAMSAGIATLLSLPVTKLLLPSLSSGAVFAGVAVNQVCACLLAIVFMRLTKNQEYAIEVA